MGNETVKQKFSRIIYPLIRKLGKETKNGTVLINRNNKLPPSSFYNLNVLLNNGKPLHFLELKGKKILLANTASDCGYTAQYAELQRLQERYKDSLQVIGFPSNDFGNQEKSNDSEIADFCKLNYGVTFPIAKKGTVVKNSGQQQVFKWLTDKSLNGWNDHQPDWNFGKYLINEQGILTHYFGPAISPLDSILLKSLI